MSKESKAAVKKAEKDAAKAKKADFYASIFKGTDPKVPPKVGDVIYVNGRMSFDHGEDDEDGGLARVKTCKWDERYNGGTYVLTFHETFHEISSGLFWGNLCHEQVKLAKEYGRRVAKASPDHHDYSVPGEWKSA